MVTTHVYPLHRRKTPWLMANGQTAGIVGAIAVAVVGSMVAVGNAKSSSPTSAVVAAAVAAVVAVGILFLGRRLGRFTAARGMVTIQSDRLEIYDDGTLHAPLFVHRGRILLVDAPGVADTGPSRAIRMDAERFELEIGPERPNIEIWLSKPVRASLAGGASKDVKVIRMQTSGASALHSWFMARPLENKEPTLIEDIVGIEIDPQSAAERMGKDLGNPF